MALDYKDFLNKINPVSNFKRGVSNLRAGIKPTINQLQRINRSIQQTPRNLISNLRAGVSPTIRQAKQFGTNILGKGSPEQQLDFDVKSGFRSPQRKSLLSRTAPLGVPLLEGFFSTPERQDIQAVAPIRNKLKELQLKATPDFLKPAAQTLQKFDPTLVPAQFVEGAIAGTPESRREVQEHNRIQEKVKRGEILTPEEREFSDKFGSERGMMFVLDTTGGSSKIVKNVPSDSLKPGAVVDPVRGAVKNVDEAINRAVMSGKDKVTAFLNNQTPARNIEDVFKDGARFVKEQLTDNVAKNETKGTLWVEKEITEAGDLFKNLKIKFDGVKDKLVFRLGEGRIKLDDLKTQRPGDWQDIVQAEQFAKTKYEAYLKQINDALSKFNYPKIEAKDNYMTHVSEINIANEMFGGLWNIPKTRFTGSMDAIAEFSKPGKKFFGFGQERTGGKFEESAIGALDAYIPSAKNQIFHTETIQRARAFEDKFKAAVADSPQANSLKNFSGWLGNYIDGIAGKKHKADVFAEESFGKVVPDVIDSLRKRVSANQVGANISTAFTNAIPLTQFGATTSKKHVAQGIADGLGAPFMKDVNIVDGIESGFLSRRFKGRDNLAIKPIDTVKKISGWLFDSFDKLSARSIVSGKYKELVDKGAPATKLTMDKADDYAAKIMADRSFGQVPELYRSKILGPLTQYQLEINNQLSFALKDIPKISKGNKLHLASMLGQLTLYGYIYNSMVEQATGRRPAIDPINSVMETYNDAKNDHPDKWRRLSERAVKDLPYVGSFVGGGRIPISGAIPDPRNMARDDWSRESIFNELKKPAYFLLPPLGGGQLKKTIEGGLSFAEGAALTVGNKAKEIDQKIKFPIKQNAANLFRSLVGGKYATPEARKFYDEGQVNLSDTETQIFQGGDKSIFDKVQESAKLNRDSLKQLLSLKKSGGEVEGAVGKTEDGITPLKNGKFGYLIGNETHTSKTRELAQDAIYKEQIRDSEDKDLFINGKHYYKGNDGVPRVETELEYGIGLDEAQKTNLKAKDDFEGWSKNATELLGKYGEEWQTDLTEEQRTKLETKVLKLLEDMQEFGGWGGFTKPKKGRGASASKGISLSLAPRKVGKIAPRLSGAKASLPSVNLNKLTLQGGSRAKRGVRAFK